MANAQTKLARAYPRFWPNHSFDEVLDSLASQQRQVWYRWFAWRPTIINRRIVWGRTILRREIALGYGEYVRQKRLLIEGEE